MKKPILFLGFVFAMTLVLFFTGVNLLALVDKVEALDPIGSLANIADNVSLDDLNGAPGDGADGSDGGASANGGAGSFWDVLRGYKQNIGDPINILVLASDVGGSNTDAIMVVHLDPTKSQVNVLSIPRDTYVTVKGLKSHKINSIYKAENGAERLAVALEDMLGQPVDYYAHMDISTIRAIVDLLDGVEYNVPCDLIYNDPTQNLHINISKGLQTLDGKQVEGLLRYRHPNKNKWTDEIRKYYDGSDLKRIERQQDFINEFVKQKVQIKYVGKINSIVSTVYDSITTDIPLSEMLKMASCLPGLSRERFVTAMLPGEAKTINDASYYVHSENQAKALADTMLADVPSTPPQQEADADA